MRVVWLIYDSKNNYEIKLITTEGDANKLLFATIPHDWYAVSK